jgi:hypothetical protein
VPVKLSGWQQNTVKSHEKVTETGKKLFTNNITHQSCLVHPSLLINFGSLHEIGFTKLFRFWMLSPEQGPLAVFDNIKILLRVPLGN